MIQLWDDLFKFCVTKAHTYNTTNTQSMQFLESMPGATEGILSEKRQERQEEIMELQNWERISKMDTVYP